VQVFIIIRDKEKILYDPEYLYYMYC